ncbi:hypothetical protein EZ428_17300 [Pedobacter frigiditerrae]|uniref:DUF3997 domain-containing protein n=1 Tax=Pedobacter frigiditerrae TaxID=2530452 RepID=A0A4R0MRB5_9SPHI|nr:hypothetical protein [Pedobacter frigiditerrae]TCC89448.1 hypothetical protein EZ428_17300 [Pedobacter frigiditerrae]
MRILYKLILLLMIASTLHSCVDKKLKGGYEIYSLNETSDLEIVYVDNQGNVLTVIEKDILAVGQNGEFIIVKQHPLDYKNVVYYYIIPLKNKISLNFEKNLIGPLVGTSFDDERLRLGVPKDLNFNVFEK